MQNAEELELSARIFVETILQGLKKCNVNVEGLFMDHLCFRAASQTEYAHYTQLFKEMGTLLDSHQINATLLVSTFKLGVPWTIDSRTITIVELPSVTTKPYDKCSPPLVSFSTSNLRKRLYKTGWEHAEFVVTNATLHQFVTANPQVTFNTSEINKDHNPSIKLALPAEFALNGQMLTIKFHREALEQIIEKSNGAT